MADFSLEEWVTQSSLGGRLSFPWLDLHQLTWVSRLAQEAHRLWGTPSTTCWGSGGLRAARHPGFGWGTRRLSKREKYATF